MRQDPLRFELSPPARDARPRGAGTAIRQLIQAYFSSPRTHSVLDGRAIGGVRNTASIFVGRAIALIGSVAAVLKRRLTWARLASSLEKVLMHIAPTTSQPILSNTRVEPTPRDSLGINTTLTRQRIRAWPRMLGAHDGANIYAWALPYRGCCISYLLRNVERFFRALRARVRLTHCVCDSSAQKNHNPCDGRVVISVNQIGSTNLTSSQYVALPNSRLRIGNLPVWGRDMC